MLNKKVCKHCYLSKIPDFARKNSDRRKDWESFFENSWKITKKVLCYYYSNPAKSKRLKIEDDPPKLCPYIMEHLVMKQD